MKEIKLTNGLVALVDDDDYERLCCYKWVAAKGRAGVMYAKTWVNGGYINMTNLIMGVTDPSVQVDHIDNNGLNNQRSNLRIATPQQNLCNRRKFKNGTSKYKGVSAMKSSYKGKNYLRWCAQIRTNGNRIYLGCFKSEEEAALAYNRAAAKYHGEFAKPSPIST